MYQRKGIAVTGSMALGALFGMQPALAQESNVQIYGILIPFLDSAQTTGASPPGTAGSSMVPASSYTGVNAASRTRLTSGTSAIGFRGSEDLGSGLKAIFQIESAVPIDGDPGPNTIASRNTNAGLEGSWGTVFFGNWDTPYKWATLQTGNLRGLTPAEYGNTFQTPGFRVPTTVTQSSRSASPADASFSRRQGNSIQYWSPKLAGFSARLAYSVNEGKTAATAAAPAISPTVLSGTLEYANGPLIVRYGYEQHKDYFGLTAFAGPTASAFNPAPTLASNVSNANPSSKDEGNELAAIYQLGNVKLSAAYERLKYRNDDSTLGKINQYTRDAWYATAQPRFGAHRMWVLYGQARKGSCSIVGGDSCSTSGLGAKEYALGYAYDFSKRTAFFAQFYGVKNEASASYGVFPSVPPGAAGNGGTAVGADTRAIGVGIQHLF